MSVMMLLIALVPAVTLGQPSPKPKPPASRCEQPQVRRIAGATTPGLHKLGDLPPAKPIYTVLRQVDGCPRPVSVPPRLTHE